jgi:hypothetical protein
MIEAAKTCLLKRMAPRGSVETPLSLRRRTNTPRGARKQHNPNYFFLRKLLARPALPLSSELTDEHDEARP